MKLTLGYSPCPNDTFIFYALTHGAVTVEGVDVVESLDDVEMLNTRALRAELDLTKVSFHALAYLRDDYCLMRSGAALGRGCGPIVVVREGRGLDALTGGTVAIPGRYTTAHLLLMLYGAGYEKAVPMPFDRVMPAVREGRVDAGLVIHEGRFTYKKYGLSQVLDLGEWWEADTGLPIPLGGILARRSLGPGVVARVEDGIRRSIDYAYSHRPETTSYIKANAREMDDGVIESHIGLYVNEFSKDLGVEGERAVEALFERAMSKGAIPGRFAPLFI